MWCGAFTLLDVSSVQCFMISEIAPQQQEEVSEDCQRPQVNNYGDQEMEIIETVEEFIISDPSSVTPVIVARNNEENKLDTVADTLFCAASGCRTNKLDNPDIPLFKFPAQKKRSVHFGIILSINQSINSRCDACPHSIPGCRRVAGASSGCR